MHQKLVFKAYTLDMVPDADFLVGDEKLWNKVKLAHKNAHNSKCKKNLKITLTDKKKKVQTQVHPKS